MNAVLKAMQVSISPLNEIYPTDPAYIFLLLFSSSSIISIALILGAPVTVPAGNPLKRTSVVVFFYLIFHRCLIQYALHEKNTLYTFCQ